MIVLDELRLGFTLVFLLVSALTILVSMVWIAGERLPAGEFTLSTHVRDGGNDVNGRGRRFSHYLPWSRNTFNCDLRYGGLSSQRRPVKRVFAQVFHPRLIFFRIPALRHCP